MGKGLACVIPEDEPKPICVHTRNFKPWTPQITNKEDRETVIERETLRYRTHQNREVSYKVTWGDLKGIVEQGAIMDTHPVGVLFQE